MDHLSLNCRTALDGEPHHCAGCTCPCHAVPPPDSFREARQALAEKLAARREGGEE